MLNHRIAGVSAPGYNGAVCSTITGETLNASLVAARNLLLVQPYRRSVGVALPPFSDGEGVVATFFLMRYQTVVASNREINFARQFFRIRLFIITVQ
jgi:hypothetical protein